MQSLPVLWLLHGTFGDSTDWIRKTSIERYAVERNLIVVMPSALNSNYSNWSAAMMGYDITSSGRTMPLVYNWLPASSDRRTVFASSMTGRTSAGKAPR